MTLGDWVTVLSGGLVFFNVSLSNPNGLLLIDLTAVHDISETTAAWIMSFQLCCYMIGGKD